MRHFATESGKSKGQFYTPAEVSRIIAQILEINKANTSPDTTVYDPTCGSGSLLLKVADEATSKVTLYGQEKDAATSGLARMNMILHNNLPGPNSALGRRSTDSRLRNFEDGRSPKPILADMFRKPVAMFCICARGGLYISESQRRNAR
jgi:type I restriction enzyme M protein